MTITKRTLIPSQTVLKAVISLWIVYHLLNIVILANGSSFISRNFQQYLLPYANTIGINSTWNFFSPDPAHTMYFEYQIHFENELGEEVKPSLSGFLPQEKDQIVLDSSRRRQLYAMRFLLLDSKRIKVLMAPWLCRQFDAATSVSIKHILLQIPALDLAVANPDSSVASLRKEVDVQNYNFKCGQAEDEVSL